MTRGLGRWIVAIVLTVALGGCAATAGDGNLVDDWGGMASAVPKVPPSGVCYEAFDVNARRVGALFKDSIPCTSSHVVETFHVGEFPAEVTEVPQRGTADYWRAFEACEGKARDFLGDDWYNGRLFLYITVPLSRQWEGGGRWYRCELIETKSMYGDQVVKREARSPARCGARRRWPSGAATSSVGQPDVGWEDMTPVDCARPHDTEYAGVFKVQGVDLPPEQQ